MFNCRFCEGKEFFDEAQLLKHTRRRHANLLEPGQSTVILQLSRKPLSQIPASDCPCCTSWNERLREYASSRGKSIDIGSNTITVHPTIFKRHLGSHLEQFALFAIPIESANGETIDSNAAIEECQDSRSRRSMRFSDELWVDFPEADTAAVLPALAATVVKPDSDESANPAPSIETVSATPLISPQPRVEVSNEAELPQTSS
jgi:hypothetical protein